MCSCSQALSVLVASRVAFFLCARALKWTRHNACRFLRADWDSEMNMTIPSMLKDLLLECLLVCFYHAALTPHPASIVPSEYRSMPYFFT